MAEIRSFVFVRHLRAEPTSHVLLFQGGQLRRSGAGLSCWFFPMSTSIAEVPIDDRPVTLTLHGRTSDFQDVTVQGVVTWRAIDPERVAQRVDFAIDLARGVHLKDPLDRVALVLTELAQEHVARAIAASPLRAVLEGGADAVRQGLDEALKGDGGVASLGIDVTAVRVGSILPTPDLERALEAPMRERIQATADEAAFARRAAAVEHERAIQENELQNRIELSRREVELIGQESANARSRVEAQVEEKRIASEAEAARSRLSAEAQAHGIRVVEAERVEAERARMELQRTMPAVVLMALAARELAQKLQRIDHVHLGGELAPLLTELVTAGTRALEKPSS